MSAIPLPQPTPLTQPHWDACREGVLRVQRCADCGEFVFIPQPLCTRCQSTELAWVDCSGRGTLYSWTKVHRPQRPEFEVPYTVAIVRLEEGCFMLTNLIGCSDEERRIGMALRVRFEAKSSEISLPYFEPLRSPGSADEPA